MAAVTRTFLEKFAIATTSSSSSSCGWFTLLLLFKKNHRRKMVIMVVLLLRTEMVAYEEEATFILRPMTRHSLRKFHCSINTSATGHPSISPYLTNRGSCLLTTCGMSLRKQCHSIILLHGDHSRKYIGFMLFFTVFHNIANITLVMLFSIDVKDCCT